MAKRESSFVNIQSCINQAIKLYQTENDEQKSQYLAL
jgi:hypothetical protein